MNIFALSGLINFISVSILGVFVYVKNKKVEINKRYAIFCFFVVFWSGNYFLWQIAKDAKTALFFSRGFTAGAIFIAVCFLHFVLALLDLVEQKKKILKFGYFIFSIFFILNFTPYFIKGVTPKLFFPFWPEQTIVYSFFLAIWFWYDIYALFLLYKGCRHASGIKRTQLKYCLLATLIGLICGSTNWPLWYGIPIAPYGNLIFFAFPGIMAIAILKYGFLTITPQLAAETIVKTIPDFLLVLDEDMNISFTNLKTLDILGYNSQELGGQPLSFIVFHDDFLALKETLQKTSLVDYPLNYLTKERVKISAQVNTHILKDQDTGRFIGIVIVGRDMREINQLIQRLKDGRTSLEEKNKQLQQLNQELQEKSRDVKRFNQLMVGREAKMMELNEEITQLKNQLQEPK